MAEKLFYTMGEVSELFDVNPSLLRYWEEQFPSLKPKRNKKGNRLYTPQDVAQLKTIYHLVKERGMKIEGARKALRDEQRTARVVRNADLMERLHRIRALLAEVREELKGDGSEVMPDTVSDPTPEREAAAAIAAAAPVVPPAEAATEPEAATAAGQPTGEAAGEDAGEQAGSEGKPRRTRRRKEDKEDKELFAFYEQSLF